MRDHILDNQSWNGLVLLPDSFVLREIDRTGRFAHLDGNARDGFFSLLEPVLVASYALAAQNLVAVMPGDKLCQLF